MVLADREETTDSRRFSVFDYFRFRFRWAAAGAMMDDGMMSAVGVHVADPRRSSDTGRCSGAACRRRCCGDPDGERRRPGCTAVLCGSVCTRTMLVVVNLAFFVSTHTRLTALFPGLPGWAGTRKVKPIWILLKQETVSGSGISWAVCKSAPHSRRITMPAPHHSVFTGLMPFLPPNQQRTGTSKHC